jgi:hypothetical protein
MTWAFNMVVPARLLPNMRERKVSESIKKWVGSFISNRTTTLYLPGYNIDTFHTHTGIFLGLPLSLIIFILYNTNIVKICNLPNSQPLGPALWTM